ncbi:hypothetical protein E2C01_070288 [Portunus trituberculatus]|uniref:Uncharacterized protein n=1 Tax=Portunus trituberculatus TaxID=210409 RepID=A0A5B7HTT2_PORTR|nr:hypothetical protein [Portunus trituberculatus]
MLIRQKSAGNDGHPATCRSLTRRSVPCLIWVTQQLACRCKRVVVVIMETQQLPPLIISQTSQLQ